MAWDWAGETRQTWGTSVAKWSGRHDDIGHKLEQLLGHQDVLLQRLHCIEDQGAQINEKLDEVLRQQGLLKQRLDAVEDARQQHGANLAPEAASNMNEGARSIMALDPQIAKQIARLSSIGLATALPSPPPPKELVKTATPSAPLWSACRNIVPYENQMLAEQCFAHGWHRVGEEFMDCSLHNFSDSEYNWTSSLNSGGDGAHLRRVLWSIRKAWGVMVLLSGGPNILHRHRMLPTLSRLPQGYHQQQGG